MIHIEAKPDCHVDHYVLKLGPAEFDVLSAVLRFAENYEAYFSNVQQDTMRELTHKVRLAKGE